MTNRSFIFSIIHPLYSIVQICYINLEIKGGAITQSLQAVLAVLIVSIISLVGVATLALNQAYVKKIVTFLVSLSVGALFGDAFLHLMPELYRSDAKAELISLGIIGGILLFFMLEKFLRWRHCHDEHDEDDNSHIGQINLVGDALHNLLDGALIGASFLVSFEVGVATTLAVILHEIPQEIGDFGVLVHAGYSTKKALVFNFVSALFALIGLIITLIIGADLVNGGSMVIISIATGGFIYIAGTDLVPELHAHSQKHDFDAKTSFAQLGTILLGVGLMYALLFLE